MEYDFHFVSSATTKYLTYIAARCIWCLALIAAANVLADDSKIYKYVDEDGNVVFSDQAPTDTTGELVVLPEYSPPSSPSRVGIPVPGRTDEKAAARAIRDRTITDDVAQRYDEKTRCKESRLALQVLYQSMPVYVADNGKYRPAWTGDTYKGEREYLSDRQRAEAVEAEMATINMSCANPDDQPEQELAAQELYDSEHCRTARADLEEMRQPDFRASDETLRRQQVHVDSFCDE